MSRSGFTIITVLVSLTLLTTMMLLTFVSVSLIQGNVKKLENLVLLEISMSHFSSAIHSGADAEQIKALMESLDYPHINLSCSTSLIAEATGALLFTIEASRNGLPDPSKIIFVIGRDPDFQ